MQIPDDLRQSVVFLYCRINGVVRAAGTACFVSYPISGHPNAVLCLLTAHHVLAKVRIHSDDDRVLIRINTRDGSAAWHEVAVDNWFHPEGINIDCAVLLWAPPASMNAQWRSWNLPELAATNEVMAREGLGLGEDVFMIGLFRNHLGRDRNEPIVRVGNICALPEDPFHSQHYGDMRAILIETRSLGGLSGAPVFVYMGYTRWREGQVSHWAPRHDAKVDPGEAMLPGPIWFLGLMHGHWELEEAEEDEPLGDAPGASINVGIGVVVPAEQVMRIAAPLLKEAAELARKQLDSQNAPVPDAVPDAADADEYERFTDLARNLVQVPKKELDEKRKEQGG